MLFTSHKKLIAISIAILMAVISFQSTGEEPVRKQFDVVSHYQEVNQNKKLDCGPFADCYGGPGTRNWNARYNERDNMGPMLSAVYDMAFAGFMLLLSAFLWARMSSVI